MLANENRGKKLWRYNMSRSTLHEQLFINDGLGNPLPIQTGTFVTKAINMEERRRLNITIGIQGSTGYGLGTGMVGGFTGMLLVQGTDELQGNLGPTGTAWANAPAQPGINGFTGALFWQTIPSGAIAITNATNQLLVQLTDVGPSYIRLAFNMSATGTLVSGTSGGSGTMQLFVSGKHT